MKLYHASLNKRTLLAYNKRFPDRKVSVLRSFGTLDKTEKDFTHKHRDKIDFLIFDSGTFSLNYAKGNSIRHITLENYINYMKLFGKYYDFYFNFDSDFRDIGFEINLYNMRTMEDYGLTPVPVVHDIWGNEIYYYIKNGYKRVALGSAQIRGLETLEFVMDIFKGTGIKIHLLGNTTFDFLANFPIHSCDSAMWARKGGFGFILYWNPKKLGKNKTDSIYMEEFIQTGNDKKVIFSNYAFKTDLEAYLWNNFQLTHQDLMGNEGSYNKMLVNMHYYVQLEDIINQIHVKKGFDTM
ncbi:MAG: hypothetical protein HOJ48_13850 [Desulfobacula sp.]|jgi:hypothetical protein|nr:hypothetical protein [Desulfobacula sp.]